MPNQIAANQSATPATGPECIVCQEKATHQDSRMWQVCPIPQLHEKDFLCKDCVNPVRQNMKDFRSNHCFFNPKHQFDDFGGAPLDPQIKHLNEGMELDNTQVQIELDPKPFRQSSDQHEPQISAFNDLRIN